MIVAVHLRTQTVHRKDTVKVYESVWISLPQALATGIETGRTSCHEKSATFQYHPVPVLQLAGFDSAEMAKST